MKRTFAKTMKKATALMLAIMLLFSCAVNVMPEQLLVAEAFSEYTMTIVGNGDTSNITYGGAKYGLGDDWTTTGDGLWTSTAASDDNLSVSVSGGKLYITVKSEAVTKVYFGVQDGNLSKWCETTVSPSAVTYYVQDDGSLSTVAPGAVFESYTMTVVGYGKDSSNITYGGAKYGLGSDWNTTGDGLWTSTSASDDNLSVSISDGKMYMTVKSAALTDIYFGVQDDGLGSWCQTTVAAAATTYYVQADGSLSTTAPTYAEDVVPSDSDVSDSDVSDSDVSDSDADNTFTVDTSAYSGDVWGSYIDSDGNEQWYNWNKQEVVSQTWTDNICTLMVKAAISSITLGVGSLDAIDVEIGGYYYSTADGVVSELPSDDDETSDSDVSDSDVSDSDVSDSDVPETENKFYIDTTAYSGNVWGSYTDAAGKTQWYNWDSQDVITQSWNGNVCTLEVIGEASNITISVASMTAIPVEIGGYYYSTADGIVSELPSDDDETSDSDVSDSDVSDSDVSDSDVSDSDVIDESEYATGTFVIDTTKFAGNVWGSYVDQNGDTQYYSWDDQSVISQKWNGYYCTLTVKEPVARITLAVYPLDEISVEVGGKYYSTADGIIEGVRVSNYVAPVIADGIDAHVILHYVRADGNYDGWGVGIWGEVAPGVWKDETVMLKTDKDGLGLIELDENGFDKDGYKVAIISIASYPVAELGFKLHQNNWAVEDEWNKDRYIDVTSLTEDDDVLHVYVYEGVEEIFYDEYDEENHNKFLAASSGSVLGAFSTGRFGTSSSSSASGSVITVCVVSSVLAVAGVAVLAWYMNSVRKEEESL